VPAAGWVVQDHPEITPPSNFHQLRDTTVAPGAHAVVLMDQAGWHTTGALTLPENPSLLFLPPKSPELNPVENIWQYLRQTWLANRVFDTYDAILQAGCQAWNNLIALPDVITSIGTRDWAKLGQ
jgi:hypothetical protein